MELQTRRTVLDAIRTRPGINKTSLARRTGLSWGTVGHHLQTLERDGLVALVRVGRTVHAAPTAFAQRMQRTPLLVCPDARRVLGALLAESFRYGTTDLGRLLGMTRKQTRRYVYDLVEAGLVESNGSYHPCYRATAEGHAVAEDLVVLDFSFRDAMNDALATLA